MKGIVSGGVCLVAVLVASRCGADEGPRVDDVGEAREARGTTEQTASAV